MSKEQGKLARQGMGGALMNPPGHPEHDWSVQSATRFSLSLSSAVECDWLDDESRAQAKMLLDQWATKTAGQEPDQDWVAQVLGYFKGCYSGTDKQGKQSWNASDLRIDESIDPMLNKDLHAGVHLVRKFYPGFQPTQEHFASAYWDKRKEQMV